MAEKFEGSNFEDEQGDEKIEISGEKFSEILSSEDFSKALTVCAKETQKTGYETGFEVDLKDKEFHIYDVRMGNTSSLEDAEYFDGFDKTINAGRVECFFDFHFHGDDEKVIVPSDTDLKIIASHPFIGVGGIDEKGNVKMLLVRKKKFISKNDVFEIADELYGREVDVHSTSQQEIMRHLDELGLENFLISFRKNKGLYEMDKKSKTTIAGIKNIKIETDR